MPGAFSGSVEARLRAAVESSPSGLLMTDRQGTIVLVNREVERLFGYSREELLGRSVDTLVPEGYQRGHPHNRSKFEADPQIRAMGAGRDLFGRRKDGTEVPLEIGLTPVATEEGMFFLAAIVDISARKQAEEDHRKLESQLRQAQKMEAVGTLAGGIAHDFNNILGVILGYVEVLKHTVVDSQGQNDLREVERASVRGRDLVKRILTFSRRAEADLRPLDVGSALEQAAKLLRVTLPATIEMKVTVAVETPRIRADLTSLHQVIMNLGNNAIQAMPEGGLLEIVAEPLYVRDHVARSHPDLNEGEYVHLFVKDSGVGMDAKTMERVFEPFFTTKAPGAGTGLGLSMVHGIVKEHGGACLLESVPGQGTKVRCLFPALQAAEEEAPTASRKVARGEGERVLLLDDEPGLVDVGVRRLKQLGYEVTGFTSADEALSALANASPRFDVVLTDYSMPSVNGVQFSRMVQGVAPDALVVMLTGFIHEMSPDELRDNGIRRVLHKPVGTPELAATLRELLKERRAAR
jgi:hypothetical protein